MSFRPPLAERMRPTTLDEFSGQQHLLSKGKALRNMLETGELTSFILWGPPGVGKTTLAMIIATSAKRKFYSLSAVDSGVKQVREVLSSAEKNRFFQTSSPILFIDEIHRFNKAQQDALLKAVEKGTIVLVGATTENPSFEVNSALLSRCQVFVLKALEKSDLLDIAQRALEKDEWLSEKNITLEETEAILRLSGGDARKLHNILEILGNHEGARDRNITNSFLEEIIKQNISYYDKGGENHYDIASAFIKSIRGSDPNAAVYWLARMIEGGEDIKFICRRMIISASEDIGLANPNALLLATTCFQAVQAVGLPEARILMSQCAIYLAVSDKSNSTYMAIKSAQEAVRQSGDLAVPLHLRNAPTSLMKEIGYGKGYQYSHEYDNNFVEQDYLPSDIVGTIFFDPGQHRSEEAIRQKLKNLWKGRYKY